MAAFLFGSGKAIIDAIQPVIKRMRVYAPSGLKGLIPIPKGQDFDSAGIIQTGKNVSVIQPKDRPPVYQWVQSEEIRGIYENEL